jgi:hypothetical protein
MAEKKSTFTKMLDIYQQSRKKRLNASLYLDTRDGKDFINFTIGEQAGITAVEKPYSTPPIPSNWGETKEEFNRKKKTEATGRKVEAGVPASFTELVHEINLETIDKKKKKKVFKIKGKFADPNRKPWFEIIKDDKVDEHKTFGDLIDMGKGK